MLEITLFHLMPVGWMILVVLGEFMKATKSHAKATKWNEKPQKPRSRDTYGKVAV
jgi:hypothetical protein